MDLNPPSLEQETKHLWLLTRRLAAALTNHDQEGINDCTESIELMGLLSEHDAVRSAARRAVTVARGRHSATILAFRTVATVVKATAGPAETAAAG